MSSKKTIDIAFSVDQASFNRVLSQVRQLGEVTKQSLAQIHNITGGMMGGSMPMSFAKTAGGNSKPSAAIQNTAGISGVASQAIVRSMEAQKSQIQALTNNAKTSFKELTAVIVSEADKQQKALDKLATSFSKVASASSGGKGMMGAGSGNYGPEGRAGGDGWQSQNKGMGFSASKKDENTQMYPIYGAAAGAAGWQSAQIMAQAPYMFSQMNATYGGTIGQQGLQLQRMTGQGLAWAYAHQQSQHEISVRKADAARQSAEAMANGDHVGAFTNGAFEALGEPGGLAEKLGRYYQKAKGMVLGGAAGGTAGAKVAGKGGAVLGTVAGTAGGTPGALMGMATVDQESAIDQFNLTQQYLDSNPMDNNIRGRNWLGDNAEQNARFMRQLRVGGRYVNKKGVGHALGELSGRLEARGFNLGDLAAAQGSIQGTGGLRAALSGRGTAMDFIAGGVSGAGNIIGSGAALGQDGTRFMRQLSGTKLDEEVQSNLGQFLGKMGTSGGTTVDLSAQLRSFQGTGGGTLGYGNQMYNNQALMRGEQYLSQQVFGGGLDNLQKARNYVNILQATGGNAAAAKMLSENNNLQAMLSQAEAGGKLDPRLKALGVTTDMMKSIGGFMRADRNENAGAFLENSDSAAGKTYRELAKGGYGLDYGRYVKEKGLRGKALNEFVRNASAIESINTGIPDFQEAGGNVMRLIQQVNPKLDLSEAGANLTMGSQENKILGQRGKDTAEVAKAAGHVTEGELENVPKGAQKLKDMSQSQVAMEQFANQLEGLAGTLGQINNKLRISYQLGPDGKTMKPSAPNQKK